MALLIELPFDDDIALGAPRKMSGFVLIHREYFPNEVIKVGYSPVRHGVGPCLMTIVGLRVLLLVLALVDLHDLGFPLAYGWASL
jgi:hypothetical protein